MKVLGIIPARGGSKGIPRKNIKLLGGRPLLAYTVESSLRARTLTRVILSTEDQEIADLGLELGVEVPFLRPAGLAQDDTPTFEVVIHSVQELESQGETYDAICLLQPTNPLRRAEDIDACIELLETLGSDSVVSILSVPEPYNPKWVYWRSADGSLVLSTGDSQPITRRQDLPDAFHRDGSVYVTRRSVLDEFRNLYGAKVSGYEIDAQRSVNIDTNEDWVFAERMLNAGSSAA